MDRYSALIVLLLLLTLTGLWALNRNTKELSMRRDLLLPQEFLLLSSPGEPDRRIYLEPGMSLEDVRKAAQQAGQTCETCWAHAAGTVTVFTVQQQGESASSKETRHEARVGALMLDFPKTGECP